MRSRRLPSVRAAVAGIPFCRSFSRGMTLLEVMIVVALVALLSTFAAGFWRNYARTVELDSAAGMVIADLKTARSNAMSGAGGAKWGVHFVNGSGGYYEVFWTLSDYGSGSVKTKTYLNGGIVFTAPAAGMTSDIIFDRITGSSAGGFVSLSAGQAARTITVSLAGAID